MDVEVRAPTAPLRRGFFYRCNAIDIISYFVSCHAAISP
jgi:hypothetical protein